MNTFFRKLLQLAACLGLALGVAWLGLPPAQAAAQSDKPVWVHYLVGPYDVAVFLQRSSLSLGRAVVDITVHDAESGQPEGEARLVIRTRHQVEGDTGWSHAFPTSNEPGTYHAQMLLERPGVWEAVVEVDGPKGGGIVSVGTLTVPHARTYSSGSYVFIGFFAAILAGGAYLIWTVNRNQRRRALAEGTANRIEEPVDEPPAAGGGAISNPS